MSLSRRTLVLVAILIAIFAPVHFFSSVRSANMTSVSVTLSTPRLSFSGILDSGNTVGSSIVLLDPTVGAAPSTSSANLFEGDTVLIGSSHYRVASPSAGPGFTITGLDSTPAINTLQAGDADAGDQVIASRSASLTVRFTTVTAITDGTFRILVPASAGDSDDALPDDDGWDYGTDQAADVTVTCPGNETGYTFAAGTGAIASVNLDGRLYHAFECAYTGAGGSGSAFDGSTFDPIIIDSLINPAPAPDHAEGFADTYPIIVQHLDSGSSVIDSTVTSVAVIESVRVTAVVSPQITFRILGQPSGSTRCGLATTSSTTPTLVPLGELLIDSFKSAAQQLIVSTNAANGYAVTTVAGNQLHRIGASCTGDATTGPCIPDSVGDNTDMTHLVTDDWLLTATKGFAYSLEDNNVGGADMAFEHDGTTGSCTGASGACYRQFADAEDGQGPVDIFGSSSVADNENIYVCYKAVISATQEAGSDYSTDVTYRATATF